MLERVHSKILCTIQGLPTRCPLSALRNLLGSRRLSSSSHRQLAFVNSIAIMESSALPRRLLEHRVSCNATAGCIPVWRALLEDLNLPTISDLLANQRAHNSWKLATKQLLTIHSNLSLSVDCPLLPIGLCNLPLGKPTPHWALTLTNTKKTRSNNFRIHLLTGCDGLEAVQVASGRGRTSALPMILRVNYVRLLWRIPSTSLSPAPPYENVELLCSRKPLPLLRRPSRI